MLTLWDQPALSVCRKADLDDTIFAYNDNDDKGLGWGGLLSYKSDGGACRTFKGFKFLDWYGLGC